MRCLVIITNPGGSAILDNKEYHSTENSLSISHHSGILAVSYFIFRKEKVVVCMKTPQALSEEELKTVFADIKKQSLEDPILHAMMKAREAELKYKAQQELEKKEVEQTSEADSITKL